MKRYVLFNNIFPMNWPNLISDTSKLSLTISSFKLRELCINSIDLFSKIFSKRNTSFWDTRYFFRYYVLQWKAAYFFHCVFYKNPIWDFIIKVKLFFSFDKFHKVFVKNAKRKKKLENINLTFFYPLKIIFSHPLVVNNSDLTLR